MIYKNFKENLRNNQFVLISYFVFIVALVIFVYNNFIIDRPLKIFENIFEITNVDIVSKTGVKIFNTHKEYKIYYKKIKNAKNNKEKYNLIHEFLKKYNSIYVGYIDQKQAKKISKIKRNKLKDSIIIKNINFNLKDFNNLKQYNLKLSKNAVYIRIYSLWSKKTVEMILKEIQNSKMVILDLRNFPLGDEKNYFILYSSFLPSDLKWIKNNYGEIVQQKKIILGEFKKIHYSNPVILITNEKTSGINGLFLSEVLDNIYKYKNIIVTYLTDNKKGNYIKYPPVRGVRYYILGNGSILYYPVSEYLNSRFKKLGNINKSYIKSGKQIEKLKEVLKSHGIN